MLIRSDKIKIENFYKNNYKVVHNGFTRIQTTKQQITQIKTSVLKKPRKQTKTC